MSHVSLSTSNRPVKADAVAEHQGRFSAVLLMFEVGMDEADVVGGWNVFRFMWTAQDGGDTRTSLPRWPQRRRTNCLYAM